MISCLSFVGELLCLQASYSRSPSANKQGSTTLQRRPPQISSLLQEANGKEREKEVTYDVDSFLSYCYCYFFICPMIIFVCLDPLFTHCLRDLESDCNYCILFFFFFAFLLL